MMSIEAFPPMPSTWSINYRKVVPILLLGDPGSSPPHSPLLPPHLEHEKLSVQEIVGVGDLRSGAGETGWI